jgi:nicotinamidase-related amidase
VSTALLVMDVQVGIVARFGGGERFLAAVAQALAAARSTGIPVFFVRVAFRPGYPEVSSQNRSFSAVAKTAGDMFTDTSPATQLHPALAARADEPVVLKKRVSPFAGSDLEILLRSRGVTRLVLSGIATSGVVLSTVRDAADRDYELVVLTDACLDQDDEVHRVLLTKVFPRQAEVVSIAEWDAAVRRT